MTPQDALHDAKLTLAAAARALSISRQTLKKWHECGYVRMVYLGPRRIPRVPRSEVDRLNLLHEQNATNATNTHIPPTP